MQQFRAGSGIALSFAVRAMRITGPGRVRLADVPVPEPGVGEARVRIEGCGVCASNLGPWVGVPGVQYPLPPGSPGHEAWGVIDAVGPGVETGRCGERVALLSGNAYAEFDVAPVEALVPLPDLVAGQPFPGEALGCAVNVFRRADILPGETVAIVGIGFLGAVLTRLCAEAGAHVIAISRRRFARDLAARLGAEVVLPFDEDAARAARALTGDVGCDHVIEAAGLQATLDLATALTREHGRLVIAGYHQDGPRQVNMQCWNWRGLDVINAHERNPATAVRGMREAVAIVEQQRLDPAALCTHAFALEELDDALAATAQRPDGFLKAVILP